MPQSLKALALTVAAVVVVPGCTSLPAMVPASAGARALAPPDAVGERSFQQILVLRYGSRSRRIIAAGQICDGELWMSLLTPQGVEMLRMRHRREGFEVVHERGLPRGLSPRSILADFQLVHWPAAALRRAWPSPWTLDTSPRHRQANYRGKPWVRVHYAGPPWSDAVRLEDRSRGYRLRVVPRQHDLGDCGGAAEAGAEGTLARERAIRSGRDG